MLFILSTTDYAIYYDIVQRAKDTRKISLAIFGFHFREIIKTILEQS